jgi:hypothetical protein
MAPAVDRYLRTCGVVSSSSDRRRYDRNPILVLPMKSVMRESQVPSHRQIIVGIERHHLHDILPQFGLISQSVVSP